MNKKITALMVLAGLANGFANLEMPRLLVAVFSAIRFWST